MRAIFNIHLLSGLGLDIARWNFINAHISRRENARRARYAHKISICERFRRAM
jgi:hypothetical protein